ncbi:PH domain protein [Rhizophagus clarus]|uniref:PH domain protein n=1 Tax=Rhizophagus clarus TaxID=94130 RepID=A0A8H3KRQ9_9GLOM|nr:PH domain protein [Rhizophagus clarus]
MEASTSTTFNSSSSSSQTQTLRLPHKNLFSSELFINAEISNKLHLHSTTRRIFIGPRPINWSYKKKSFFFSKSIYAEPLKIIKKNKFSQSGRNSLTSSNGIINKRERQVTFIASRDSIGPTNLSSLDYYEIISKSRSSVEIVTDSKFLVSEPQDLESGPSGGSKTSEIYYTPTEDLNTNPISLPNIKYGQTYFPSLELEGNKPGTYYTPTENLNTNPISPPNIKRGQTYFPSLEFEGNEPGTYYTPTENLNTNPISPPNIKRGQTYFPSLKFEENEPGTSHVLLSDVNSDVNSKVSERFYTPITESHNVLDEQTDQESDNENHETFPPVDENSEVNNGNKPKYVRFSESTATTKPSNTIIKQNSMLVRIYFEKESGEHLVEYLRDYDTKSYDWKELMVKLKPGGIEFYENKNKLVDRIYFTSTTKLSLFSSSDYTILITQPAKHYVKGFILNPRTISLSIQWYQTIYKLFPESVNKPIPCSLDVIIPDLDVKLRIPLCDNNNEEGGGCNNEDNKVFTLSNVRAEEVINVVLNELSEITEWDDVLNKWVKSSNLRLCWKSYEKLEWINLKENGYIWNDLLNSPQFVEQAHQLQLRPIEHYPTTVKLSDGTKLTEPPPIEGYLIKMTNNKSQNNKSRKYYFTSQNNYLFFLNPLKASPPPPPNVSTVTNEDDGIQLCDNAQQHPLIYAVSPYIQDKIVGNNDTFMKSDMKRKAKQILHATGFIDLIEIVEIKCLKNDGKIEENLEENLDDEVEGEGCLFQLLLKNGGIVSLKAYSKQTRKEWVKHLNELANYWKARLKQDVRIRIDNIKTNQSIYRENKNNNELRDHNWENFKSYADPVIWNGCILDGCRGITKSGLLYHRKHDMYQTEVITNQSIAKSYSEGPLAKLYGDGMISYDDYKETSFVIWKSKRKYYFSNDGMKVNMEKIIKYGIPGDFWIFRTRNRIEREEWVWALNVEIERLCEEENNDK